MYIPMYGKWVGFKSISWCNVGWDCVYSCLNEFI